MLPRNSLDPGRPWLHPLLIEPVRVLAGFRSGKSFTLSSMVPQSARQHAVGNRNSPSVTLASDAFRAVAMEPDRATGVEGSQNKCA